MSRNNTQPIQASECGLITFVCIPNAQFPRIEIYMGMEGDTWPCKSRDDFYSSLFCKQRNTWVGEAFTQPCTWLCKSWVKWLSYYYAFRKSTLAQGKKHTYALLPVYFEKRKVLAFHLLLPCSFILLHVPSSIVAEFSSPSPNTLDPHLVASISMTLVSGPLFIILYLFVHSSSIYYSYIL